MAYKCRWCQYRHGGCPHDHDDKMSDKCKGFKIGGCYSCKYYYGNSGKLNKQETDQWFARGCEIWCPSSLWCGKRKRLSRKRKKRLKKMGVI